MYTKGTYALEGVYFILFEVYLKNILLGTLYNVLKISRIEKLDIKQS